MKKIYLPDQPENIWRLLIYTETGGVQQEKQQMQWARKSWWIYTLSYAILYISNTVIIQNIGLTQPNSTINLNNQNFNHKATKHNYEI
jgi:hypothetical protein